MQALHEHCFEVVLRALELFLSRSLAAHALELAVDGLAQLTDAVAGSGRGIHEKETGELARYLHCHHVLGDLALAASMLARCSGEERYFSFLNILYGSQKSWSRAENPMQALVGISRMVGLSKADVEQCFDMDDLLWGITEAKEAAAKTRQIDSTPTFFIDGQRINGNLPYEDFKDVLEKALAKKAGN